MDYFKELQGFAERIRSIEPGTYFSRLYQTDHTGDDEQRQIISLLQELQLAMESPSLLSVPPEGTVLHLGAADKVSGAALSHLCVALEKCLFFGAEGSMPDFWWVLDRASENDTASSPATASGGGGGGGGDGALEGPSLDAKRKDVDNGKDGSGGRDGRVTRPPEPLAASIHRLTRVHTGHARCRAWARGLLGMNGAAAEGELRKAAASVAHLATTRATPDESSHRAETGDNQSEKAHAAGTIPPSAEEGKVGASARESDPDAGGGVGRSVGPSFPAAAGAAAGEAAATPVDLPTNSRGRGRPSSPLPMPPPASLLPLWLRSNAKGSSVLDDVCRSLVAFQRELDERGLSIRPSLDHAWLDQESLAAVTTYTWPRFRRAQLRCHVRGAGLAAANGEYLPADADEGKGKGEGDGDGEGEGEGGGSDDCVRSDHDLTLLGPNGCKICRKAHGTSGGRRAVLPAEVVVDAAARLSDESTADPISGRAVTNGESETAILAIKTSAQQDCQAATTAPVGSEAPVARLWHLLVPAAGSPGLEATSAYFCLGDGPLPPSRGWRSADDAGAPAPVLRFATQTDDGGFVSPGIGRGGREDPHRVDAIEEESPDNTALFRAALPLPPVDAGVVATGGASAADAAVAAAGEHAVTEAMHGRSTPVGPAKAVGGGRSRRGRKRRRPAAGVEAAVTAVVRESSAQQGLQAKLVMIENESVVVNSDAETCGGSGGCGGRDDTGGGSNASADDDRGSGCEATGDDGAIAAFKAERWRLPEPSGELLAQVVRSKELLQRAIEESTLSLAMRRRQLQEEIAVADQEFQEVLRESTESTVERVLAARPHLREEAEAEVAIENATAASSGGGADLAVPSLEELVAEKAEELRTRLHSHGAQEEEEASARSSPPPPSSSAQHGDDRGHPDAARQAGGGSLLPVAVADAGWPWPADWLAAPFVPPPPPFRDVDILGLGLEGDFVGPAAGDGDRGRLLSGAEDGSGASGPPIPFSIEVAAVEVTDAEDPDAAHIEYVLRVVYRERMQETTSHVDATPSVTPETRAREPMGIGGAPIAAESPKGCIQEATDLLALVTAAKGLLQRTRVLSKRLNSLCAIHPQLMWELKEARRLRPEAEGEARIKDESLQFPDPFELGTQEESILRVHRDKLTPRFKANSPTRKLSARVGTYLSGLLRFMGVLEAVGESEVRSRMAHVLNDALSTCDRAGRKRRRGDFVLSSRVEDIAGGRLGSGGGDEERLRVQKRSCMGCGRAIAAEFLGIKKDYSPCRFADGLFCRSYCHAEDRRVIPHRVVHHWDFATHRVCRDARAFLDATRFLPVFDLPVLSPLLFTDHESLRMARWRRKQLHLLRRAVFSPPESKCASGARLFEKLLGGRMHLATSPGLYSLEDLVGVRNGILLDFLQETNEVLSVHVTDDCDVCEARAARVCDACDASDPIFAFQIESVTECSICERLFHTKCIERQASKRRRHHQLGKPATGSGGSSKWWLDHEEAGGNAFVCMKCEVVDPVAEAVGE
eukprot:g5814.t1